MKPDLSLRPSGARVGARLASALSLALGWLLVPLSAQVTLVTWDIPSGTASSGAVASSATGVNATSIARGPGLGANSSSTLWRTNGWNADAANDYLSFSVTAGSGYSVVLDYLILTANVQAGSSSTWTTPSLQLLYTTDSSWASGVTDAGSLSLGSSLAASTTGSAFTAATSTYFSSNLTIAANSTYYFRLVAQGGNATNSQLSINSANDMVLWGTATALVTPKDLLWTGAVDATWNGSTANFADTGNGNAASAFGTVDSVTIDSAAAITVQEAGVSSSGSLSVTNSSGTVALSGGSLSFSSLAKSGAGTLTLASANTFSSGVTLSGGTIEAQVNDATGTGTLTFDGGALRTTVAVTALANTVRVADGGGTLETAGDTSLSGGIATTGAAANASHAFTKTGAGTLTIGGTVGSQMTLDTSGGAVNFNVLGGDVVFSGTGVRNLGGTMTWDGDVEVQGGSLMLHGGTISGTGTLAVSGNSTISSRLNFGAATVSVPVSVANGTTVSFNSASGSNSLNISGPLSGSGHVAVIGNGITRLNGTDESSFTGTVAIEAGTQTRIATTTALGAASALTLNGNLSLQNTGSDTLDAAIGGSGALTINLGSASTQVTLTAASTHAGATTVQEGVLLLATGSSLASPTLTVQAGGTLAGAGTASGAVTLETGGFLSPGSSPGTLTLGSATLAGGSTIVWEANAATGSAGSQWDLILVNGALSLTATAENPLTLQLHSLLPDNSAGAISGFNAGQNYSFSFLTATGGITGYAANVFAFDATDFANATDAARWTVTQAGNSLVLNYAAIPEPGTYALLLGAAACLLALRRRRRHA